MATKKNMYVDNNKFLECLAEYNKSIKEAKKAGKPKPRIPDTIGEFFMLIAQRRSNEHNFVSYPFKEDMVSDAILNCVEKVENFDPKVSENPFAYFSQVVFFAFIRRIQEEKKKLCTKFILISDFLQDTDFIHRKKYGDDESDLNMREFIDNFKKSKSKKSKAKKKKGTGAFNDLSE